MIKGRIKGLGRLVLVAMGLGYDFWRFFRWGGWRSPVTDDRKRAYEIARASHSVEKGLAFLNRDPARGGASVAYLTSLAAMSEHRGVHGFEEEVASHVLQARERDSRADEDPDLSAPQTGDLTCRTGGAVGGAEWLSADFFREGLADDPESFFLTRRTVREMAEDRVAASTIERAVELAMNSPSSCNRQPWRVYHITDAHVIAEVLVHQSGNRGFGHTLQDLLVVGIDQTAFVSGNERYQHWIEGGLFTMTLIWAFHSLGCVTCALNWSVPPAKDLALRRTLPVRDDDAVIVLLGVGYARNRNRVPVSARRGLDQVLIGV